MQHDMSNTCTIGMYNNHSHCMNMNIGYMYYTENREKYLPNHNGKFLNSKLHTIIQYYEVYINSIHCILP